MLDWLRDNPAPAVFILVLVLIFGIIILDAFFGILKDPKPRKKEGS